MKCLRSFQILRHNQVTSRFMLFVFYRAEMEQQIDVDKSFL